MAVNGEWLPERDPEADPADPVLLAEVDQTAVDLEVNASFSLESPDQPEPGEGFTPTRFYKNFQHVLVSIDIDMDSITLQLDPSTGFTLTAADFQDAYPYEVDYVDLATLSVVTVNTFSSVPMTDVQISKFVPYPEQSRSYIFTATVTAEVWQTTEEGGEVFYSNEEGPQERFQVTVIQNYDIGRDALQEAVDARSN